MITIYSPILIKRSSKYGNNYWETYSPKVNRNVGFFSDLEYDHWVLVEANPYVETFCEQPFEIEYFYDGKICKSIPDMWIKYYDNTQYLVEIKYLKDLSSESKNYERTIHQIAVQKAYCQDIGVNHCVYTEKEIRGNPVLLSNMKMIIPYIKNRPLPIDTDKKRIIDSIRNFGNKATIGMIQKKNSEIKPVRIREAICSLLYNGIILGNLDKIPYSNVTEVWLYDSKTNN